MYDMNDPEVVESLKYLLVPKEERIRLQALPFDGKKACWIPDHKEGYLAAEIQSTKGEEVTVKTSKGEVIFSFDSFKSFLTLFFNTVYFFLKRL